MKSEENGWSGKSRGGSFGYKFFIFLISRVGIKFAYAFLSIVVLYFIPFAPRSTRSIWRYNRAILKYGRFKSIIMLYSHYYIFGQELIDKIAVNNGLSDRYSFEFENLDRFKELYDKGAAIMIGGHIGCWEIGSVFFSEAPIKLNIVMYDGEYDNIKNLTTAAERKYNVIALNNDNFDSIIKIKKALDDGEFVCFQGDRYMDKTTACRVNFMGRSALFPKGPSLLASKFNVPVVFYFAMRERGMKYRFIFYNIEKDLSQTEILNRYLTCFESTIRRYPQQWFNFFDLWEER